MKLPRIKRLRAREILDSRGDPTLEATVELDNGLVASAAVPAGASTGSHEAREVRDGGERFGGKGVRQACQNVTTTIQPALVGMDVEAQLEIDRRLVELDGTPNRSRLGANALLGVSLAVARAGAATNAQPLYRYLGERFNLGKPSNFPVPMCNVLNGGKHADNGLSFQEYLVLANGHSCAERIERTWKVIHQLKRLLQARGDRTLVGDEGGFAPLLKSNQEGLTLLVQASEAAGLQPGQDVSFGLDVAASEFYRGGKYHLSPEGETLEAEKLMDLYRDLAERYPLTTLEDGLAEDDWANWTKLTQRLGKKLLLIGDDLFVTQADRLSEGVRARAGNAILIKPNQVGTLTETMATIAVARDDGYAFVVSHRSGETGDSFIADLAVATGSLYLKAGSLNRSERLAKYNRLLEIAAEAGA